MADDYKIAQPVEYYKHFLKENIRPDGRQLTEFRRTVLNVGTVTTARGSAVLKLGHTMVVRGVTAELAEPTAEHPKRGYFVPNVELPPLCSLDFRPGPPDDKAQVLSQVWFMCAIFPASGKKHHLVFINMYIQQTWTTRLKTLNQMRNFIDSLSTLSVHIGD